MSKWIDYPIHMHGFNGSFPLFDIGLPSSWDRSRLSLPSKPLLINPVPIAFLPWQAVKVDDAKEYEGVSFAELWSDPVARTLWLGHKRFMITSQYFRLRCIQQGHELRRRPQKLLEERIVFNVEHGPFWPDPWLYDIGTQLGPYLAWALQREGKWPYWKVQCKELRWKYEKPKSER